MPKVEPKNCTFRLLRQMLAENIMRISSLMDIHSKKYSYDVFHVYLRKTEFYNRMQKTWFLFNKAQRKVRRMGWEGISPSAPEWTGRDLNSRAQPKLLCFPRPPRCQRGDHARLIYQPSATNSTNKNNLSIMHRES